MENSKKRKRDVDCPRISYHTLTRAFDRLFQERSLDEMKEVVRKKLRLDARASISFAQIRDGKSVDLEDDDDFDAFYALAHSTNSVDVKVTVVEQPAEVPLTTPMTSPKKKRRKNRQEATDEQDGQQQLQKSVAENKDLAGQISNTPLDPGTAPRKKRKRRKTGHANAEASEAQLISQARESSGDNGDIAVQGLLNAQSDTSGEPRNKKKSKVFDGDSVAEAGGTNKSPPDPPCPSTTLTNLLERAGEDVTMASIQTEDTTRGRENMKQEKKKHEKKQKPQGESTLPLPKPSASIQEKRSKVKGAHDNSASSGAQGATESVIPAPTEPETGKSSTKRGRSHEKNKEKRRKSGQQRVEVDSAVVNAQSYSSPAEAMTETQLNTQQIDKNEVELNHVHEKNSSGSSTNVKKSRKEPKKLTPDERKAAEAEVNAIFAKVLAAKRAEVATAHVNVTSTAKQGDVVSSSKSKSKKAKGPNNLTSQSFDLPLPDVTSSHATVEPPENASKHSKSASSADCPKPTSTCPLCLLSPLHERMACPLVLGGPESLRERLHELQKASDDEQSNRTDIMSELYELLRVAEETLKNDTELPHNTQLQKLAPVVTNGLVEGASDELTALNHGIPPHSETLTTQTTEMSDGSDDSSDDEYPRQANELSSISHDPKFLEELNLEDLIRGPISAAAQIADLDSSDNSEDDEGENEENQVLEEDEPKVPRRSQNFSGVLDSSDEADSGVDEALSTTEEPPTPNDAPLQRDLDSGTDHVSFQNVDRTGESQEVDRSADIAFGAALEMDTAMMDPAAVPPSTYSDSETEAVQSLAPSSQGAVLVKTAGATPLNRTSLSALPAGPSATQPLVSTPLTGLRDSPSAHDTRDDPKPAGMIQRMKTRNGKTPISERNLETQTMTHTPHTRFSQASQSVRDSVARRTRAATRRETLGTMTPPVSSGRQSRLILPASQSTEDLNVASTSETVMSLDAWATLKPSSPMLDADATMMVDELASSPSHHDHVDVNNPNENKYSQDGPAEDPLFIQSESLLPFPYSQRNAESQEEFHQKPDKNNKINTLSQGKSRDKLKQRQSLRYRRLTDITSDHGFLSSTPTNLRATRSSTAAQRATDMYGRKDEIESESDSDSGNSDAREESHIPKSRMAGTKRK